MTNLNGMVILNSSLTIVKENKLYLYQEVNLVKILL